MQKQQNKPSENQTNINKEESTIKSAVISKKKVIKKFPFLTNKRSTVGQQDDKLKNWKPEKLKSSLNVVQKMKLNNRNDIASQFLSFLPKPTSNIVQNDQKLNIFQQFSSKKTKPIIKQNEQQMKWDAQDEFLQKKVPQLKSNQYQICEKSQRIVFQQDDDQDVIQKIQWLNQQKKKGIDLASQISKTWQKQQQSLFNFQDQENAYKINKKINKK